MSTFRCERFPDGEVPVRTAAGLVWFQSGRADVDDADLAAALREVPPVFGIVEEGGPPAPPAPAPSDDRPSVRASKAEWVAFAGRMHDIPAEEAEAMTKAELVETFGG